MAVASPRAVPQLQHSAPCAPGFVGIGCENHAGKSSRWGPGGGRKPDPTLVAFGIDELRVSLEESVRFPKKARSLVYLEGR